MSDKEKENQVQEAIGTMKRQMYIACGSGTDLEELFDGFRQAIQNFGLFMYNDPSNELYAFIISNEKLSPKQVKEFCQAPNLDKVYL